MTQSLYLNMHFDGTQLVRPSNDKIRDEILKRGSEQAQVIQT